MQLSRLLPLMDALYLRSMNSSYLLYFEVAIIVNAIITKNINIIVKFTATAISEKQHHLISLSTLSIWEGITLTIRF